MAVSTMASWDYPQLINTTPYTISGWTHGIESSGTIEWTPIIPNYDTGVIPVTTKPSKLDWSKYPYLSEDEMYKMGNCEVDFHIVDYDSDDILSYRIDVKIIRDSDVKCFRMSRDVINEFELAVYDEVNDILNIGYLKCSIESVHLNGGNTVYLLKILNWDEL